MHAAGQHTTHAEGPLGVVPHAAGPLAAHAATGLLAMHAAGPRAMNAAVVCIFVSVYCAFVPEVQSKWEK
jgi:hypothetical protein